jgi:hypothetical protein
VKPDRNRGARCRRDELPPGRTPTTWADKTKPTTRLSTATAHARKWTKFCCIVEGLKGKVMGRQPQDEANCSDEEISHRRSKLAGWRSVAGGYESEEKSRKDPIRRRRSKP